MLLKAAFILAALVSGGAANQPALPGQVQKAPNFKNNPYLPCLVPAVQSDSYSTNHYSEYSKLHKRFQAELDKNLVELKRHQDAVRYLREAQQALKDFENQGLVPCSTKQAKK